VRPEGRSVETRRADPKEVWVSYLTIGKEAVPLAWQILCYLLLMNRKLMRTQSKAKKCCKKERRPRPLYTNQICDIEITKHGSVNISVNNVISNSFIVGSGVRQG